MIQPTREAFRSLAREHTVVPVWREVLADLITPVAAFARVVGEEDGFLLESVEHGERWSRFSFVGRRPVATLVAHGLEVEVEGDLPASVPRDRGILAAIDALLAAYRSPSLDELPPLHGGLVGYLAYDVVREVEHLPAPPPDDRGVPDAVLCVIGQLAVFDHWRQRVTLLDNVVVPDDATDAELDALYDAAVARVDELAADGTRTLDEPVFDPPTRGEALPDVRSTMGPDAFERAVETCKEHILAGDVFEIIVSQRFDLDLGCDPFDLYRVLRQLNPSPYMYFVRLPALSLVGSSPEPLVKLVDGRITSRPIAGTRFRGRTEEHDRRLAAELLEHPKEVAEHVMLVDLARNDVGRVAEYGSVVVDELMALERYSHVMHMTSQVSGRLRDGASPVDVLRATLPAGTVSGAPKVRAMQLIDELEATKRGVYAGVVGYLDFSGNLDVALAIRTMVVVDGVGSIQAGAGIVADSDPADEELECHNKAAALLAAVPAARRMTAARRAATEVAVSAWGLVLDRPVVLVEGPDAATYLQGQLSQDVAVLPVGGSVPSLLLSPQGHLVSFLRVGRADDEVFALDVDGGTGDDVVARLTRFLLRTKATVALAQGWRVVAVRGAGAPAEVLAPAGALVCDPETPGVAGYDLVGPAVEVPADATAGDPVAYEALRIERGVPRAGAELGEKTIPAEAGIVDRSVSFTKGCYTGQELVARIDSRGGNVPRRLRGLVVEGDAVPPIGAVVVVGDVEVGAVTSAARSTSLAAPVALAYAKRGTDVPTGCTLRWDGGSAAARLVELPLT